MTTIRDLNYFVALLFSGSMLALWGGAPLLSILFMFAGAGTNGITLANVSAISTVLLVLLIIWRKNGALLPSAIKKGAETRYRVGTAMATLGNSIVLLSIVVGLLCYVFNSKVGIAVGFIFAGALLVAVPLSIAGIICIESSRLHLPPDKRAPK